MYFNIAHHLLCYSVVYGKRGYKEVVERISEESMQSAVEEAKGQANYSTSGEVNTCTYVCSEVFYAVQYHYTPP